MLPSKRTQNWLPGIFNDFLNNEWFAKLNGNAPAVNIIESDKAFKVEIAAPGITKDDFKIKVNSENQLIISMEKKHENEDKNEDEKYLRREFSYAQFQQTLLLPDNIDKDKIDAQQANGVLTIVLPKKSIQAAEKSKIIPVK